MRIHARLILTAVVPLAWAAALGGCADAIGPSLTVAPNAKKTLAQLGDAPPAVLVDEMIARQMRVDAGDDREPASLSVWVIEPWSVAVEARLWTGAGEGGAAGAYAFLDERARAAATRPARRRGTFLLMTGVAAAGEDLLPTRRGGAAHDNPGGGGGPARFNITVVAREGPGAGPDGRGAARGTVLLLPGIGDRKENVPYVLWARALAEAGYRAVLVDLRGQGRSTGRTLTYGAREGRDLSRVLDELEKENLVEGPVAVWGLSYGAAVAIQWAADEPRVKAVIAFEPFATMSDAVVDFTRHVMGWRRILFPPASLRAAAAAGARRAGFDVDDASPLAAIARMTTPVLLVHGTRDLHLPPRHSERLYDAGRGHADLLLMEGDGHLTLWIRRFDVLRGLVTDWLGERLRE